MSPMAVQFQANWTSASLKKPSTWLPNDHHSRNLKRSSVSVKPRTCSTSNARSLSELRLGHASRNLQRSVSASAAEPVVAEESPVNDDVTSPVTPLDTEVHLSLFVV